MSYQYFTSDPLAQAYLENPYQNPYRPARRPSRFGAFDSPFGIDPLAPIPQISRARKTAQFPQIPQEDSDSLLRQLGQGAMGTLQYAAETLDKPGAAARGLLAGRPDQLLNLIPFSDTLGITSARERTSGRDLLEMYGIAPPNREGFHPFRNPLDALGDVTGLATEVVTDPLFWLSSPARALTSAGQQAGRLGKVATGAVQTVDDAGRVVVSRPTAAQLASEAMGSGQLAPTVASRIAAGQGGLTSLWNPFGENIVLGTGPRAQAFAERVLDPLGDMAFYNPVMRGLRSKLAPSAQTTSSEVLQRVGDEFSVPNRQMAEIRAGEKGYGAVSTVEAEQLLGEVSERAIRMGGEGVLKESHVRFLESLANDPKAPAKLEAMIRQSPEIARIFPASAGGRVIPEDAVEQAVKAARSARLGAAMAKDMRRYLDDLQGFGIDVKALEDAKIAYFARHHADDPNTVRTLASVFDKWTKGFIDLWGRKPFLKDLPYGTVDINDMARDLRLSGPLREGRLETIEGAADVIAREYLGYDSIAHAATVVWKEKDKLTEADHATQLAEWLTTLSPKYADEQLNLFNAHPAVDYMLYTQKAERAKSLAETLYEMVARSAVPTAPTNDTSVLVRDFMTDLEGLGLDVSEGGTARSAALWAIRKARPEAAQMDPAKILGNWLIPERQAAEIKRFIASWSDRRLQSSVLEVADHYQNLFKGMTTLPWPAFHSRNLVSGMFYNFVSGNGFSKKDMDDAFAIMTGQEAPHLAEITLDGAPLNTARATGLAEGAGAFRSKTFTTESLSDKMLGGVGDEALDPQLAQQATNVTGRVIPGAPAQAQVQTVGFQAAPDEFQPALVMPASTPSSVPAPELPPPSLMSVPSEPLDALRYADENYLDLTYEEIEQIVDDVTRSLKAKEVSQLANDFYGINIAAKTKKDAITQIKNKLSSKKFSFDRTRWGEDPSLQSRAPAPPSPMPASDPVPAPVREPYQPYTAIRPIGGVGMGPAQPPDLTPAILTPQAIERGAKEVLLNRPLKAIKTVPQTELEGEVGVMRRYADAAERHLAPVLNAGAAVGQNVEDFVRLSHFIGALRNGMDPVQAALSVKRWHFDYRPEGFSWAERNILKRLFPFYSFMSRNLKLVASELLEAPGGRLAQSVRAANQPNVRRNDLAPGWITEKAAIPLGPEVDGSRKYVTGLGLPFEQAFEMVNIEPTMEGTMRRSVEGILSQARPEIKGGLEQLANRQFFFGRPLDQTYSLTGYQPIDQLLYNSPAARLLTTYRQFVDPRKTPADLAVNLATGLKVSDVDVSAARREAEDRLRKILVANPSVRTFENLYVPKDRVPDLDAQTILMMRLYNTISAQKRAEARAKEAREIPEGSFE